jgi:hypothetical protein
MLFDLGLVLVVALVAVATQASSVGQVPIAGTHIVSFAACLFVINSASGLYEPSAQLSFSRSVARALLVLLVALPLAYAIFGLLPDGFANRQAIQASMMAGVAALILRRAYMSHSSVAAVSADTHSDLSASARLRWWWARRSRLRTPMPTSWVMWPAPTKKSLRSRPTNSWRSHGTLTETAGAWAWMRSSWRSPSAAQAACLCGNCWIARLQASRCRT